MIFNLDITDLIKVNLITWVIVGLGKSSIIDMGNAIQLWGMNILIIITISYTVLKLVKLSREMVWDKVDREEDKEDRRTKN